MNSEPNPGSGSESFTDRLESYGIDRLAVQLFQDFWEDADTLGMDFRGRELARQQVRSLDSVCANMEEGYGRGYGKELPYHLEASRGEARESKGRYARCAKLLPAATIQACANILDRIIGGLSKNINTLERRSPSHPPPDTRHNPQP